MRKVSLAWLAWTEREEGDSQEALHSKAPPRAWWCQDVRIPVEGMEAELSEPESKITGICLDVLNPLASYSS